MSNNGINVNVSSIKSKITDFDLKTDQLEKKIKIRNHCLLGESKESLVNWSYEDVLGLLLCGFERNVENRKIIENKIKESYSFDYSYQFKFMKDNIKVFEKKPLVLAEMAILSLSKEEGNELIDNVKLFIQCFVVLSNLFNLYVGRDVVLPNKKLSIIENFLMMIGQNYNNKNLCKIFSKSLIAWIDCGLASSAIVARINISARADFIPSIVSGFINCTGKKHTSARIECAKFLLNIRKIIEDSSISVFKDKKQLREILKSEVQNILDNGKLVHGFGHYIFKGLDDNGYDPRIYLVRDGIKTIFPNSVYLEIVEELRKMFVDGEFKRNGREFKLPPNSDIFWTPLLLDLFNDYEVMPVELISVFNIMTRLAGIIAHSEEQYLEYKPVRKF